MGESRPALRARRAQGKVIGTRTNGNGDALAIEGLRGTIDFALTAQDVGDAKPSRAMFDAALTAANLPDLQPGECVLLHNLLLHRSGVNRTGAPRRAISVAYIDARSQYLNGEPDPAGARPHAASAMVDGPCPTMYRAGPEGRRGGGLAQASGGRG